MSVAASDIFCPCAKIGQQNFTVIACLRGVAMTGSRARVISPCFCVTCFMENYYYSGTAMFTKMPIEHLDPSIGG